MFSNYLAAALRNLVRSKLIAAINIVGLTVGFAAAVLIAVFVRDELTFDRYFPGYRNIYLLSFRVPTGFTAPIKGGDMIPPELAANLRLDFPFIKGVARVVPSWEDPDGRTSTPSLTPIRVGDIENNEDILWADPNIFEILKFRPVAGNVDSALSKPDSIVLTRSLARKYFSKANPIGRVVEINTPGGNGTFTVTAVIEDLPYNTHLRGSAVAAGQSTISPLARVNATSGLGAADALTYISLSDMAAAQQIEADLPAFMQRHKEYNPRVRMELHLNSLASLHFAPGNGAAGDEMKPRGSMDVVFAMGAIGLLILSTASINFVNLMTARASRRATEVGVRKVSGAARRHLIAQFIGESMINVFISMGLGLGLAALLLPGMNGFLDRTIRLALRSDPTLGVLAVSLTILVGILAGLYPAVVLSSFRPAAVFNAAAPQSPASATVRQSLVMLQFALLIGLLIATGVIARQIDFALTEAQRLDADEVLIIDQTCRPAFKEAVAALSGVRATTCSYGLGLTDRPLGGARVRRPGAESSGEFRFDIVDPGFFEFYGFTPIAGRFFDGRISDAAPQRFSPRTLVINETMVRKLGFASPQAAIGQTLIVPNGSLPSTPEIVGVVADFATDTIRNPVQPIFFYVDPAGYSVTGMGGKKFELGMLSIRLIGAQAPETLTEIDRLWKRTGSGQPISRFFLKQSIQARVADLSRQGTLFAIAAAVAIFIALLGLFGMSVFVAEHRTKEIGVRKAMGASRTDILGLLLWEFSKPVLWANLLAWPTTYYLMKRWLEGFAYHVDLEPWTFLAASALAVVTAVLTVVGHALLVARAQPVAALRYE